MTNNSDSGDNELIKCIKIIVPQSESLFISEICWAFSAFNDIDPDISLDPNSRLKTIPYITEFSKRFQESTIKYPELNDNKYKIYFLSIMRYAAVGKFNDPEMPDQLKFSFAADMVDFLKECFYIFNVDQETSVLFEKDIDFFTQKRTQYFSSIIVVNSDTVSRIDVEGPIEYQKPDLYYWPHAPRKLDLLYELLLEAKMVAETVAFRLPFSSKKENPQNKVSWLASQTSLFVLLYCIYGNEKFFEDESIHIISMKLFTQKGSPYSAKSTLDNFKKISDRIEDDNYIDKKHEKVIEIIQKLAL